MINKFKMIFIVGVGRSGTTLVQGMLNAHSKIAFTPETHFIKSYLSKNLNFNKDKNKIIKDKYLKNLNLDLKTIQKKAVNYLNFYELMMNAYRLKKSKLFIGDKDPNNIENLKIIKKYFPNSIIVNIYRDPRAVIASRIKAKWSRNKFFWQHILAYKAQFNYMLKNKHIFGKNYVEIKYEKLLLNPKIELEKILTKLNLKFEKKMLKFSKNANEIINIHEISWKKNLLKPILCENIYKWKNEIDPNNISKIEKALYVEMETCGYKFNSKSNLLSLFYNFLSKLYCIKNCN